MKTFRAIEFYKLSEWLLSSFRNGMILKDLSKTCTRNDDVRDTRFEEILKCNKNLNVLSRISLYLFCTGSSKLFWVKLQLMQDKLFVLRMKRNRFFLFEFQRIEFNLIAQIIKMESSTFLIYLIADKISFKLTIVQIFERLNF